MKIFGIIVLFALSVVVKGDFKAAVIRHTSPIILSVGAAIFAKFGIDLESKPSSNVAHYERENNERGFESYEDGVSKIYE